MGASLKIDTTELLLFSDLHLDQRFPKISQSFTDFIDQQLACTRPRTLFILGDLFESWVGDDVLQQQSWWLQHTMEQLHALSAKAPTYYIHGNRDFLIGRGFEQATNIHCLPQVTHLDFHNYNITLCHGDHLCTQDTQYMAFRELVRSQQWQDEFLAKPLQERQAIAQAMRAQSKTASAQKQDTILDVNPSAVQTLTASSDLLIHGHTHRPKIHAGSDTHCSRVVLGDWTPQPSWLSISLEAQHLQGTLSALDWQEQFSVQLTDR